MAIEGSRINSSVTKHLANLNALINKNIVPLFLDFKRFM
jgi:hypothetical protein